MPIFWRKYPALLYGLAFLLGCCWGLSPSYCLLIPTIALSLAFSTALRHACALFLALAAFFYVKGLYHLPSENFSQMAGQGYFAINSLGLKHTHFGTFWVYKGTLKRFEEFKNIPITISVPDRPEFSRPPADKNYLVKGVLKRSSDFNYQFKWDGETPWQGIDSSFSLAEIRYGAKRIVEGYIQNKIPDSRSATLLAGLATGDFDDTHMQYQFGRFGLQHIMAISGFHFSILAAFFSFVLQLIVERKWSSAFLIAILSSYFLFLGMAPSILRAWIACMIMLGGYLLEKKGSGLNSLGVGLLLVLIYNPLYSMSLGFQFSFTATAAIFLLYPLFDQMLSSFLRKRQLKIALEMPLVDQHGFIVMSVLRQGLALTLAVNLVALPMMLYYFQKFPLMSLVYNLFFPFLISVAMLLLLLGCVCPGLHLLNSWFTARVLDLTYNMPTSYATMFYMTDVPGGVVIVHLTVVFALAMFFGGRAASLECGGSASAFQFNRKTQGGSRASA